MEGAPNRLVAAEGEGDVGHAAADLGAGALPLDLARGTDEVDGVVVVLRQAGAHGEDVGVENDVLRVEAHLLHQDAVGALADAHLQKTRTRCGEGQRCDKYAADDGCAAAVQQPSQHAPHGMQRRSAAENSCQVGSSAAAGAYLHSTGPHSSWAARQQHCTTACQL